MAKTLNFEYDGTQYTLEFTKGTVRQMENNGFIASDIDDKPMTILPDLFAGAFLAHHRFTKRPLINEIYKAMPDKGMLIRCLIEMYNEPLAKLIEEPKSEEGNVVWTPSWKLEEDE